MRDLPGKSRIPNPKPRVPTSRDRSQCLGFGVRDFGIWDLTQGVLHSLEISSRVGTMRARWYFAAFALTLAAATVAAQISTSSDAKPASSLIRLDLHATL